MIMDRMNKNVIGRMFNRQKTTGSGQTRKSPLMLRGFDALEARVVLSGAPTTPAPLPPPSLAGSLAIIGVIPSQPAPKAPAGSQLAKDMQKLQADTLAVQAKSNVTVSELTALRGDDNALAAAKADGKALMQAQLHLVKAVQSGNPGAAHAEFVAVFAKADAKQVEKAFQDEVKIIIDSHISPAAVAAIAADNAAIQKDLAGTTPPAPPAAPPAPPAAGSQLAKDAQKRQNDTLAVQIQSGVTIAELTALQADEQAIIATGYKIDGKALLKAQTDLTKAVLAGNPAAAKNGFVAIFGGKVDINLVNKLFNDEVSIIKDSHITASALDAIAADNAAIQKDLLAAAPANSTPPPAPMPSFGGSLGLLGVIPS
jgi:hypothetical protein